MSEEMRKAFCDTVADLMAKDDRIMFLDADLAKANGTSPLYDKYPDRTFNVGIAEANMAGVAAGLASYGMIPFIATFTPFATRRICDQAYISIAYARQNVKIVGTDPGITAELNGGTHTGVDDVGIMRGFPGMLIYEPVDTTQIKQAIPQIVAHEGPVYMRMPRKVVPDIFGADYTFDLKKADVLRTGKDVTLFASGMEVKKALDAAESLSGSGIDAEVISVHTTKPIDAATIVGSLKKTGAAVTCENHSILNGLGSAVMELAAENHPVPVLRIGLQDRFGEVGKLDYLIKNFNMDTPDIVEKAKAVVAMKKR